MSRTTRIRTRYLAALEDDAGVDSFPGPVYARFFLKEYARYLGVDDAPLVAALRERTAAEAPRLELVRELEQPRRWVARLIRVCVVASLLALIGYSVLGASSDHQAPGVAGVRAGLTAVPPFDHRAHASIGTPRRDVPIRTVVVVLRPTYVRVYADGQRVVHRNVLQPRKLVIRSKGTKAHPMPSVDIWAADGSAVKVVVNGRKVPTDGRTPFHARFVVSAGRTVRM